MKLQIKNFLINLLHGIWAIIAIIFIAIFFPDISKKRKKG